MSFDIILPFLRPIAHLIQDPDITEIMVNGSRRVFVEREGVLQEVDGVAVDERNLRVAVKNIARALGDDVSEERPILDSRLPDGSRVAAVFPPCSVGGTTLTIRKFQTRFFTAEELVRIGSIPPAVLVRVRDAIQKRQNILISGGTSTGKTTLLNALAAFVPPSDRVVVIEHTAELQINSPNLLRFEARREQTNLPAVSIRDLLRATLRHRPDRIVLGEVRGGEAYDLLQALNTGQPARCQRSTRTRRSRHCRGSRRASFRAVSNCQWNGVRGMSIHSSRSDFREEYRRRSKHSPAVIGRQWSHGARRRQGSPRFARRRSRP
jgi:pilus assembly protein CpaF